MTETREQHAESETAGGEPGLGSITVAAFVLSELLCFALLALVFL
jgi:hypothetical protein